MTERDQLILEIMALAYAVDRCTDYAVFIDYSGHVESLSIRVVQSKTNWQNEIVETEFKVTGEYILEDPESYYKRKRDFLMEIVEQNNVDLDGLEPRIETVSHFFP